MSGKKEIAVPLHIQRIEKSLRLDPFLKYVEEIFDDGSSLNLSDSEDNELTDDEQNVMVNGEKSSQDVLKPYNHPEKGLDKSWYYNVSRIRKDRKWLKDVLLSDSSDSSDDDEPLTDQDLKEMLRVHKLQKMCQTKFYVEKDLHRFMHYSASLFSSHDKYYDLQKQIPKKFKKKKAKEGKIKILKMKKEKIKLKKRKKKVDGEDDDQRGMVFEERMLKKKMIRRKEADARRKKLWAHIVRKDLPKTQRQKASARNSVLEKAKKLAQLCQKEMRREALRSQKTSTQNVPRARRLAREMMVYWKKYDKVEKEHRKRAEKVAMEQRKIDDELREARRQQRKLNFLITQTELYAHFMSRKLKGGSNTHADNHAQEMILKKLDENRRDERMLNVHGGIVFDADDNHDNYDSEAMKQLALQNAEEALKKQESMTRAYGYEPPADPPSKIVPLTQEYFDETYSLANPMLVPEREVAQPELFDGLLKSYQLKGMNWLVNLYEQGINGILADEMGLGKTVQSIAFLAYLAETNNIWGPFLVVAPASTLHNWQQEVSRFVSDFKVLPYWGNQSDRKSLRKYWNQNQSHTTSRDAPFHVLITSYQLVVQDARYFQRIQWQYLVLDEAQAIKSTTSVRWKVLLSYPCRNRLLLTGTPIQNSMAELWALLHFIMPTLFDSHDEFNEWFSKDIESHAEHMTGIDQDQLSRLHMILKPFMLRRIKRDVENELSDKIEIKCVCNLTSQQRWLYRAVRNKISIDDLVYSSTSSASTTNNTTSNLMNLVMQFRKVCNHPELFERRDVQSPIHLTIASYNIPKLVYREGILESCTGSKIKLVTRLLGINTSDYIHHSLFPANCGKGTRVISDSCFSFTRFVNISPEELSTIMLKGVFFRMIALLRHLQETSKTHHLRFWSTNKTKARHLDQRSLMMWPDSSLCFAAVQTSTILNSMIFTSLSNRTVTHNTHVIKPAIHDKGSRQKTQKTTLLSPSRTKQLTPGKLKSPQTPISPTKQHATTISPQRHPPPAHSSQDRAPPHLSPLKHSSTPLSPTRRAAHHDQLSPKQTSHNPLSPTRHSRISPPLHQSTASSRHNMPHTTPSGAHPLSPQVGQFQHFAYPAPHQPHPSHQSMGHHSGVHSHQGHQVTPSAISPTRQNFPSQLSPTQKSPTETSHKRSHHSSKPGGHHKGRRNMVLPTAEKIPDIRHNQPTALPDFLSLYVPKVVFSPRNFYCNDRMAAYEADKLVHGKTPWQKNLLNYGSTDVQYLQARKKMLYPPPLGGIEACKPPGGWTHIHIPSREILITDSGKMNVLDTLLTKLKAGGHRVLIYSQMTRMIDLLEEYMTYRKHKYMRLDGSSKICDRRDMVADFQSKSDIFVFLLSTRAGGLGINLTAADTVIFYDSDWNPTVDQQAMDRAHRLGQTRQVTVYRLVTKGTIEERILQRAKEKSEIQRMVISGGSFRPDALKPKEVVSLLLDDAEMECKFLQRQAEKKVDEQKKRKERKRKKEVSSTASSLSGEGVKPGDIQVAPPKAKKGRKRKNPLPEPPLLLEEDSKAGSIAGSINSQNEGEIIHIKPESGDGDISVADDVSIMSLDEVSVVSGESSLIDNIPSSAPTPSTRPDPSEAGSEDLRIDVSSPAPIQETNPKSKARGRPRGRGRVSGPGRTRGGAGSSRGRGRATRGRGGGAMAAAAAAMAGAHAASAAAYAAYGFTFHSNTPNSQPPSRNSPVAFGSVPPGASTMSHPVPRYGNVAVSDPPTPSGGTPSVSAENSPARPSYVQSLPGFGPSGS